MDKNEIFAKILYAITPFIDGSYMHLRDIQRKLEPLGIMLDYVKLESTMDDLIGDCWTGADMMQDIIYVLHGEVYSLTGAEAVLASIIEVPEALRNNIATAEIAWFEQTIEENSDD